MSTERIASRLIAAEGVKRELAGLVLRSVRRDFTSLTHEAEPALTGDSRKLLLLWASVFASAESTICQDAALRVAFEILHSPDAQAGEQGAAAIILQRLANRPGEALARRRLLLTTPGDAALPAPLEMERTRHAVADGVTLASGEFIQTNRFQRALWDAMHVSQLIGASAPTSAGKSYILMRWLEESLRKAQARAIVYIVPTRALVAEVEKTAVDHLTAVGLDGVWVSSVPTAPPEGTTAEVVVATQERFHLMLREREDWSPDVLIVDEAQKVSDGRRGVLLQQVIAEALRRRTTCQVVLAGPQLENPEELLEVGPMEAGRSPVLRNEVTVVQNLLWAEQVPRTPKHWVLNGFYQGQKISIGKFELHRVAASSGKRLPLVAQVLSGDAPGNLVYANGAAEAEKYAKLLSDGVTRELNVEERVAVEDVVRLVKDAIHPRFPLVDLLRKGVAYHYGNLPTLVRSEIERLFKENIVRWLVCTSTLMEGVNLPCRNLFIRGPRKGNGNPMQPSDFWNLAGRAGRWGVEFSGNIVCVDPGDVGAWPDGAPSRRVAQRVVPVSKAILAAPEPLLDYLRAGAPCTGEARGSELEGLYSHMASVVRRGGTLRSLPWIDGVPDRVLALVESEVQRLDRTLTLPEGLIFRNPGISPTGMEHFLRELRARGARIERYLPAPPEDPDAVQALAETMGFCDAFLGAVFGSDAFRTSVAIVTIDWMRGKKLREIIEAKLEYLRRKNNSINLGQEVRRVLETVEQYSRYRVPKYLGCYTDVLRHYVTQELEDRELAERVPDFSEALELGVSQRTHVSLMMLGMSRYSAIAIAEYIRSSEMTPRECIAWLRGFDASAYGLPSAVAREVEQALSAKSALLV